MAYDQRRGPPGPPQGQYNQQSYGNGHGYQQDWGQDVGGQNYGYDAAGAHGYTQYSANPYGDESSGYDTQPQHGYGQAYSTYDEGYGGYDQSSRRDGAGGYPPDSGYGEAYPNPHHGVGQAYGDPMPKFAPPQNYGGFGAAQDDPYGRRSADQARPRPAQRSNQMPPRPGTSADVRQGPPNLGYGSANPQSAPVTPVNASFQPMNGAIELPGGDDGSWAQPAGVAGHYGGSGATFDLPARPGTAHAQDSQPDARSPPKNRAYWGDFEPDGSGRLVKPAPGQSAMPNFHNDSGRNRNMNMHTSPQLPSQSSPRDYFADDPNVAHEYNHEHDDHYANGNYQEGYDERQYGGMPPPPGPRDRGRGRPGPGGYGLPPTRGRGAPRGRPDPRRGRGGYPPPKRAETQDSYFHEQGGDPRSRRGPPPPGGDPRRHRTEHGRDPRRPGGPPRPGRDDRGPPPGLDGYGPRDPNSRRGPEGRSPADRRDPRSNRPPGASPPNGGLAPPANDNRPSSAPENGTGRQESSRYGPQGQRRSDPDALPHHPTPPKPGLNSEPPKPKPVRQYTNQSSAPPPPGSSRPQPLTQEELARVKQQATSNPNDQSLQLNLAKKFSEAARVLCVSPDPKTRKQDQERYNMEGLKIVKRLVAAQYPEAVFYQGDCYSEGNLGLNSDPKEAFSFYQSAAKLNHAEAAYRTAVCCEIGPEDGGGTRRDPQKAMQWYKRSASLGHVGAMFKMGMILLKGLLNQEKSPGEAVTWLKRAADQADADHPHALHELGLIYEGETYPPNLVPRDEQEAYRLFLQAAKYGFKYSQFKVGTAHEYGLFGQAIDARTSIIYYTKAAAQGEHQAELALSGWYLTGAEGILEHSDTEAYLWARKAATASGGGLPKAMYAMGYYSEIGIGCQRSLEEAKKWYSKAAAGNFPKAHQRLDELKRGGAKAQKNRERLSRSNAKQQEQDCVLM